MIYIFPTDTCYGIACAIDDKKSYEKIYKMKKRKFDKPLAIMVSGFDWLRKNTDLLPEQVDFLERYEKPFTILTNSDTVELFLQYADDNEEHFINKDVYTQVAFRVASNGIEEKLIKRVWPIWLTSANTSESWENYNIEEIEEDFAYYIEKGSIEILGGNTILDEDVPASDVFRFDWETLELEYVRKN